MIISEMQSKLATWSASDPHRRFDRMLRLIAQREWLHEAAHITLSSKGSHTAGIDGVHKAEIERNLDQHLEEIRHDLLAGSYEPQPARRVYIPKPNGKQRPLGIPTLRDRIVQRAMLMAMEPIWESDFHRLSYGFRPERSVHHAAMNNPNPGVLCVLVDAGADTAKTDSRGKTVRDALQNNEALANDAFSREYLES